MAKPKTKLKPGPKPKGKFFEWQESKEELPPEEISYTMKDGTPIGVSIKINENGIAIGIRHGHGSQSMPLFGITPTPKPGQVGVQGGGDGNEPPCP
jgi:hypothetical protein